jgi:Ni/Co efflux regulator RcnB
MRAICHLVLLVLCASCYGGGTSSGDDGALEQVTATDSFTEQRQLTQTEQHDEDQQEKESMIQDQQTWEVGQTFNVESQWDTDNIRDVKSRDLQEADDIKVHRQLAAGSMGSYGSYGSMGGSYASYTPAPTVLQPTPSPTFPQPASELEYSSQALVSLI